MDFIEEVIRKAFERSPLKRDLWINELKQTDVLKKYSNNTKLLIVFGIYLERHLEWVHMRAVTYVNNKVVAFCNMSPRQIFEMCIDDVEIYMKENSIVLQD